MSHAQRAHGVFAPSGSERWIPCPGSIKACEDVPADPTNEAAERGTAAHELLQACILSKKPPIKFKGKQFNKLSSHGPFIADEAMCNGVEYATDYVRSLDAEYIASELEVFIPATQDKGHVDVLAVHEDILEVVDYKNGVGVVEAKDNTQTKLYGLGGLEYLRTQRLDLYRRIRKVRTTIVQPNAYHPLGPVRSHTYRLVELEVFSKEVAQIVRSVHSGDAERKAGEQCKWCPARARCHTYASHALDVARTDFSGFLDGKKAPAPGTSLTNDQLVKAFLRLDLLETWCATIRKRVNQIMAEHPEKMKGLKVVEGRAGNRFWIDPEKVKKTFKKLGLSEDEYMPRELVGIGAAEKLLDALTREAVLKKLTNRAKPQVLVVAESDPRPSASAKPEEDFKEFLL